MSDNSQLSTSGGYYNSIQLHDELRSGEKNQQKHAKTPMKTYFLTSLLTILTLIQIKREFIKKLRMKIIISR